MNTENSDQQRIRELESELQALKAELASREHSPVAHTLSDRYQHLLGVLPAGVVLIDGSGVVAEANPAAVAFLGEPLQGSAGSR